MRQLNLAWSAPAVLALAAWLMAVPASAMPQRSQSGGRPTSSHPAPSGGGGSRPAPSGGGSSGGNNGGGSNGGGQSAPTAVPKNSGGTTSGTSDTSGSSTAGSGATSTPGRPTSGHAPASGATVGHAAQPAPGTGSGTVVIPNGYYGGFYPWGWAGLGFGGYYGGYYGYYDPWVDSGGGNVCRASGYVAFACAPQRHDASQGRLGGSKRVPDVSQKY